MKREFEQINNKNQNRNNVIDEYGLGDSGCIEEDE